MLEVQLFLSSKDMLLLFTLVTKILISLNSSNAQSLLIIALIFSPGTLIFSPTFSPL